MRELINNITLALVLDLILFALFRIVEYQSKTPLPEWFYILMGCLTMMYSISRKENKE